jgi:hypothetical protein
MTLAVEVLEARNFVIFPPSTDRESSGKKKHPRYALSSTHGANLHIDITSHADGLASIRTFGPESDRRSAIPPCKKYCALLATCFAPRTAIAMEISPHKSTVAPANMVLTIQKFWAALSALSLYKYCTMIAIDSSPTSTHFPLCFHARRSG